MLIILPLFVPILQFAALLLFGTDDALAKYIPRYRFEDLGSGMRNILHYAPLYYKDYEIDIQNNRQFEFSITYSDAGLGSTTQKTTKKTTQKMTEKAKAILDFISEHPTAGRKEIAHSLEGISESGVKYHLRKLQDDGIIKRVGPDKGGHWEVVK